MYPDYFFSCDYDITYLFKQNRIIKNLAPAVVRSDQVVNAQVGQLDFVLDGLTKGCRKKPWKSLFDTFTNVSETTPHFFWKETLSCRSVLLHHSR